eukprot:9491602-Heterocapsa_arctica.AAC.1
MPGKRDRVARSLEVSTRTLTVMHSGKGSSELFKIIPEPLTRPAGDIHRRGKFADPCTGDVKTGSKTPAGRRSRAH